MPEDIYKDIRYLLRDLRLRAIDVVVALRIFTHPSSLDP